MKKLDLFLFLLLSSVTCSGFSKKKKQPNILLIVADDLGFNDVSWNNPEVISPNLEKLARSGTILENNYVNPICTPSRSALLTGYYTIHNGRQTSIIWSQAPLGLYTNFTLLPEYLSDLGYSTHAVGKWHLGYCHRDYLPTNRGFDSFHGYYTGSEDYYHHTRNPSVGGGPRGYDLHVNEEPDFKPNGTYSSVVFADYAKAIIKGHPQGKPLFLYYALQNVHSPLEVPNHYKKLYPRVRNHKRRKLLGMVTALDDAVGEVIATLKAKGFLSNTIIAFTSDNGGQTLAGGNNWPLRGNKGTLWEGGTRVPGFLHIPGQKGQIRRKNLFHITDWVPTLVKAAGGDLSQLKYSGLDGIDQWDSILTNTSGDRNEVLYNINPCYFGHSEPRAALRVGDMKLLRGNPGEPSGWIPEPQTNYNPHNHREHGSDPEYRCNVDEDYKFMLFNLTSDPEERMDLSSIYPEIVEDLASKLVKYEETMIPPIIEPETARGNPNRFGGVFSPGWCQSLPRAKKENADLREKSVSMPKIEILP